MLDTSWQSLLQPGDAEDFFAAPPRPFDPAPTAFDAANAFWLAELSRLAYRDDVAGRRPRAAFLGPVGLAERAFVDDRGTQCLLVGPQTPPDFTIIAFRGTSELRHWLTNLRALPAHWSAGGHVHRGFRRALARAWRRLRRSLAGGHGPLFCTGHSLGGALALLAASLLRPRAVYTFGAPRVGDAAFAASLAAIAVHELVNAKDIVPHLPPAGPPLHACAAGPRLCLTADGRLVGTVDMDHRPIAAGDRRWHEPWAFLSDHAPVNYVTRLRALLRS